MEMREELGLGCASMENMDHMTFACVCMAAWAARTLLSAGLQSLLLYLASLSSFHFTLIFRVEDCLCGSKTLTGQVTTHIGGSEELTS